MLAHCHHWSGHADDAIAACRSALRYDPKSFDMHALLSQLLSEKGEHEDAVIHARRGLENYPEPLPEVPSFILSAHKMLSRFVTRLRDASPDIALERIETDHANWFNWAKIYLEWYDSTYGDKFRPTEH